MYRIVDSECRDMGKRIIAEYGGWDECFSHWKVLSQNNPTRYEIESFRLYSGLWINVNQLHRKEY